MMFAFEDMRGPGEYEAEDFVRQPTAADFVEFLFMTESPLLGILLKKWE